MASLKQQIAGLQQQLSRDMPAETVRTLQRATASLKETGIEQLVPVVGDRFPRFTLPNAMSGAISSEGLLEEGPLVVVFYRGGWCPYCNLELRAYQDVLEKIAELGASLVAISPQLPEESLTTAQKLGLKFETLSDTGNSLAGHLRLAYSLPEAVKDRYRTFGNDLERINGDLSWTLPMPATFVVGTDGLIKSVFARADYGLRQEPEEVLEILAELGA
jgi:peroxiredoxin